MRQLAAPRVRVLLTVVLVLALGLGTSAYVLHARAAQVAAQAKNPSVGQAELTTVLAAPHVVFRSTALGSSYGEVSVVSLADPSGARVVTDTSCDRVYAVAVRYVCLTADRGMATVYRAQVLGPDLAPQQSLPLAGIPSRARLSADGTLAATTSFVSGHSYAQVGFSTQTVLSHLTTGTSENLEDFQLVIDGVPTTPTDRNLWGVTFVDDDTFYATAATGGRTWLVRGSVSAQTLTSVHDDAECPSVSPDGRTVVYKKRQGRAAGQWRLAALDLHTGVETLLSETRVVDDQVEWLDGTSVIYGVPREGSESAVTDVWRVPVDGSGAPAVFIPQAWSPAVVR